MTPDLLKRRLNASLGTQFTREQLQALVDRHFGKQPPLSRLRLTLMLDSRGMPWQEYERLCVERECYD